MNYLEHMMHSTKPNHWVFFFFFSFLVNNSPRVILANRDAGMGAWEEKGR